MDDNMVNKERTCTIHLHINSYGSLEHLEKTVARFLKVMELQNFRFHVESLDMDESVVATETAEEVNSSEEIEFDYGVPIPVRVFSGYTERQVGLDNISKTSNDVYRYDASVPEFNLFLYHYSKGGINKPKAYLRSEGSTYILTLHESDTTYSGSDPRGEIVSQITKEI